MALTKAYCTLEEFKQHLSVNDFYDDFKAESAIASASRQIDAHCDRWFWQDSALVDRYYEADEADCLTVDDISTATGVVVATDLTGSGSYTQTLTLNTHFRLEPVNAAVDYPVRPYTELEIMPLSGVYFPVDIDRGVKVTAKFGWPAVPDAVNRACIIQAIMLFKAPDAAFGAAQLGLDGNTVFLGQMHSTARGLLEPFIRRDRS